MEHLAEAPAGPTVPPKPVPPPNVDLKTGLKVPATATLRGPGPLVQPQAPRPSPPPSQ